MTDMERLLSALDHILSRYPRNESGALSEIREAVRLAARFEGQPEMTGRG
jgi:hypothetical protein